MVSPRISIAIVGLLACTSSLAAGKLYCCQDAATGRRVCADVVPEQCKTQAYKVLDETGNVIREVGPPLTPEQKAAQAAEAKRKAELEAAMREQKRRDLALLETYPSVQSIDAALSRAEAEVAAAVKQAEMRIEDAKKRRKTFEAEAEFYVKREMPRDVARGLKDADDEIKGQTALMASKQKDLDAIRAKYAEDKRRYLELQSGGRAAAVPPASNKK